VSISKDKYSLAEARKWLEKHGYKTSVDASMSKKSKYYHFRQTPAAVDDVYVTKEIEPGIELVLHREKKPSEKRGSKSSRKAGGSSKKKSSKKISRKVTRRRESHKEQKLLKKY
jgi:hypothetical protein